MKIFATLFLVVAGICGLMWVFTGNDLAVHKTFDPKYADLHRNVFEHSQSYIQGKIDYISQLRLEFETADKGHKQALRNMILTQASTVDLNQLPADMHSFINSLKDNVQ